MLTRRLKRPKSKSQCHQTKSNPYYFPETTNGIPTKQTRKLGREDSAKNSGHGRILCNKKDASTPTRYSRLSTQESGSKLKSRGGSLYARTTESKSPKNNRSNGCCVCEQFTTFCRENSETVKELNCEHRWHQLCREQFMKILENPQDDKKAKASCPMCLIKSRLFGAFGSNF